MHTLSHSCVKPMAPFTVLLLWIIPICHVVMTAPHKQKYEHLL